MQFHQLVGQHLQRPVAPSQWRFGAGQCDQACLTSTVESRLAAGLVLLLANKSSFQSLFDEPLANPLDGGDIDLDGFSDAFVGPARSIGCSIGLEEDAGVSQFQGCRLTGGDQIVQRLAFGGGERDLVLLDGGVLPVPP